METTTVAASRPGTSRRGVVALLSVAMLVALAFWVVAAAPYLTLDQARFGPFWPKRDWLLLHIAAGSVALFTGPLQLWLGMTDRRMAIHRRLGVAYVAAVAVGSVAAYYLALHNDFGWVYGAGLAGLATAWVLTTGLAYVAIRNQDYDQHKEWMIRSYVVTFAFVGFRAILAALMIAHVGTETDQFTFAAWSSWTLPLLLTEVILQGRKIRYS